MSVETIRTPSKERRRLSFSRAGATASKNREPAGVAIEVRGSLQCADQPARWSDQLGCGHAPSHSTAFSLAVSGELDVRGFPRLEEPASDLPNVHLSVVSLDAVRDVWVPDEAERLVNW